MLVSFDFGDFNCSSGESFGVLFKSKINALAPNPIFVPN